MEAKGIEGSNPKRRVCVKKEVDDHEEEIENTAGRSSSRNPGKKKVNKTPTLQENKKKKKTKKKNTPTPKKKKKACVECTNKCLVIHGCGAQLPFPPPLQEGDDISASSFFKIMIGNFNKVLFIPPKFRRTLEHLVDEYVNIRDSFGLRWRVRLSYVDGVLAFSDGWQNFVLDHLIEVGEFVIFTFLGKRIIYARIFSISACERQHFCERNQRQSRKNRKRKLVCDNTHGSENLHHSHPLKKQLLIAGETSAGGNRMIQTANPDSRNIIRVKLESIEEVLEPDFQVLAPSATCNDTSCHITGEEIPSLPTTTADTLISSLPITEMLDPLKATQMIPIQNACNDNPRPQENRFENSTENVASCGKLVEICSTNELEDQSLPTHAISEDIIFKIPKSRKKRKRKLVFDNTNGSENLHHSYSLKKQLVIAGETSAGRNRIQTANLNSGNIIRVKLESQEETLEPIQINNDFQALASSTTCNDTSCHITSQEIPSLPKPADTSISSLPVTEKLDLLKATKMIFIQNAYNHNPGPQENRFKNLTGNVANCGKLVENCSTNNLKEQRLVLPIQAISEDLLPKITMPFVPSICTDNNKLLQTESYYEAAILPENNDIFNEFQGVSLSPLEHSGVAAEGQMEQISASLTHLNIKEQFSTAECSVPVTAHCDSVYEMEKQKLDSIDLPVFSEFKCDESDTDKTTVNGLSAPQTLDLNSNNNNSTASLQNIQCNSTMEFQIALAVINDGLSPLSNNRSDEISADQTTMSIRNGSLINLIVTKSGSTINSHENEIEYHMPDREDTQSQGITGEENTDSNRGKENSPKIMTIKSLGNPDSLEETSNHAVTLLEVKEEVACAELSSCEVKTECPSPVSQSLPDYETFSFSMRISASSSWIELPLNLPFQLTKRNCGKKVVFLQDSCKQLWPVLYQKTTQFNGFTSGWKTFAEANNLKIGDECEFELCKAPEATLKVKLYNKQDHPSN